MPPKKLSIVAQRVANAKAAKAAATSTSNSLASTESTPEIIIPTASTSSIKVPPSLLPPATSLPSEPMDLDNNLYENGEGDTEMADIADKVLNETDHEQPTTSNNNNKGKGKANNNNRIEMNSMQNVENLIELNNNNLEGMEKDIWKGKGISESIKNVEVSFIFFLIFFLFCFVCCF